MTEQDIIKLAQEMIDAHMAHDNGRLGATVTDDFLYDEFGTQRSVRGRQAWLDIWQGWRQTFPDVKGAITTIFVSGNQALAETVWDGTFSRRPDNPRRHHSCHWQTYGTISSGIRVRGRRRKV